ncbi:MAG: uroporphyrinogen-III synthase [Georgfuchsia sp.]
MPLAGKHIVVTRPTGQVAHLAEALQNLGAHPILFPVLVIRDLDDVKPLRDISLRLDEFDFAVFVSPNAVDKSLEHVLRHRSWPMQVRVATVGESSERALARHGITNVLTPRSRFDSEALLELPELQDVAGRRIVIFRGDGGRELLGDVLRERGAEVLHVASYQRGKPDRDGAVLLKHWEDRTLDAITVTSSEGLRNLHDMVGKLGQAWLRKTPLFVPHARISAQAAKLGHNLVQQTNPGDDGLVAGLIEYFSYHG